MLANESKDYFSMYSVQAEKLQHNQEQEERSRQTRDEEILPFLQRTHFAQRNKVIPFGLFILLKEVKRCGRSKC